MPHRFRHVFFDATDTLLCVRGSVGAIYAPEAARFGFVATAEAIDTSFRAALAVAPPTRFPGASARDIPQLERDWWRDVVQRTFAPLGRFVYFDGFFDAVFEAFRRPDAWELVDGARAVLETLRAEGRRLGIVSEMDGRLFDVLDAYGLRGFFDCIALSSREGALKSDGELFRRALEQTGASPETSAHVGDSPMSDVAGALRAGMTAIRLARGRAVVGAEDDGHVVDSLEQVPRLLRRLEA